MPGNIVPLTINQKVDSALVNNDSLLSVLRAGPGFLTTNTVNFTTTGVQLVNIFQVIGRANIQAISGVILDATAITNVTGIYFDLWDGSTATDITKNVGANLSSLPVGTSFVKNAIAAAELEVLDAATELEVLDGSNANLSEAAGSKAIAEFLVTQKPSTNTYIRFGYTAGAAIDITIAFGIIALLGNTNKLIPV